MDPTYSTFAAAHPVFYAKPPADASPPFTVATTVPWDGWQRVPEEHWTHWVRLGAPLPEQGWKIHVSTRPENAARILGVVSEYCQRHNLTFKHVRSAGRLITVLAKDSDRASAGKFITIYPRSDRELHTILTDLDEQLCDEPGPYILSDLRWRSGPLHVRYGAFQRQFINDGGVQVPAVRRPDTGDLVPDKRDAAFTFPDWVAIPDFLSEQQEALELAPPAGFPTITKALHYSNAGGVYEGVHGGTPVVLKEARPHSGWTPDGRDAVQRLDHEEAVLRKLHGHAVPEVLGVLTSHGHRFITMSRVPGIALPVILATTHPLTVASVNPGEIARYRNWALAVAANLRAVVVSLHDAGITHGDLHPANVIVDGEDVHLIDFEMALTTDSGQRAVLGAPGFIPPDDRDPIGRDLYAVACIELHLFYPQIPLLNLDEHAADRLVLAAQRAFDLDSSWVGRQRHALRRRKRLTRSRPELPSSADELAAGIAAHLQRDATVDDDDRLWPGDPRQFEEPSAAMAHGAGGVALVLQSSGTTLSPSHIEWIRSHHRTPRNGLMNGAAGIALACRSLGLHSEADELSEQVRFAPDSGTDLTLYSGSAGVGLFLLEAVGDVERAADMAHRSVAHLTPDGPRRVETNRGGLLRGASGVALLSIRLFEKTGDGQLLSLAERALNYDIASLTPGRDGSLHVNEGWRAQPYLAFGSAGIGTVVLNYLRHRPDHQHYRAVLADILRAASAQFTVQSGLFHGRAGLIHFLVHAQRFLGTSPAGDAAIDRHLIGLRMHLTAGLRTTGDSLLRASCDLATGSSGVLSALIAARALRDRMPLPSAPIPYLLPTAHPGERG